jgi:hypothetical protein
MKILKRLPLYLGFFVFVISILFSAVRVGSSTTLNNQTKANLEGANLQLLYSEPDTVSILLNSVKSVSGIDIVLNYDSQILEILPSTLQAGGPFTLSGGLIDEENGTFSFSSIAQEDVASGIIANFQFKPKVEGEFESTMSFDIKDGASAVYSIDQPDNILTEAFPLTFTIGK